MKAPRWRRQKMKEKRGLPLDARLPMAACDPLGPISRRLGSASVCDCWDGPVLSISGHWAYTHARKYQHTSIVLQSIFHFSPHLPGAVLWSVWSRHPHRPMVLFMLHSPFSRLVCPSLRDVHASSCRGHCDCSFLHQARLDAPLWSPQALYFSLSAISPTCRLLPE